MHEFYKDKKVLVTGCRGYKGSWLVLWLQMLGAEVIGYGHFPETLPNHNDLLGLQYPLREELLDYYTALDFIGNNKPDIVFHLAAHAIVPKCFKDPRGTFTNNVGACVNILEVCKNLSLPIVFITTDKVYEDESWKWENREIGYREDDVLGGKDPYSASKVCMEHIIRSYRECYGMNIAVARAGNVIGGGDWNFGRLIPDIMKAASRGEKVQIHTPSSTRPWQHVLSALDGYLILGEKLLTGDDVNRAWNFGPQDDLNVLDVLKIAREEWDEVEWEVDNKETHAHMVNLLKIDSCAARQALGWKPPWNAKESIRRAVKWYKAFYETGKPSSEQDIKDYMEARNEM